MSWQVDLKSYRTWVIGRIREMTATLTVGRDSVESRRLATSKLVIADQPWLRSQYGLASSF